MKEILNELPDKQIIDASPVELGLVQRTVCSLSGKLATEACAFDASGHVPVTDWFASDSVPVESCDMHGACGHLLRVRPGRRALLPDRRDTVSKRCDHFLNLAVQEI